MSIPVTVLLVPWAKLYCHKNDVSGATGENPKQLHPRSIGHSKCCAAWNANSEKSDQQVWLPSAHCHNILFLVQKSCDCETVVQVTEKLILRDTVTPRLFYIWDSDNETLFSKTLRYWDSEVWVTESLWDTESLIPLDSEVLTHKVSFWTKIAIIPQSVFSSSFDLVASFAAYQKVKKR